MQKWEPDNNPRQARRVGKTMEELAELTNVLARISIQGLDAIDPGTGLTNRERMYHETADVLAQLQCNIDFFGMDMTRLDERMARKVRQMGEWEKHFEGDKP